MSTEAAVIQILISFYITKSTVFTGQTPLKDLNLDSLDNLELQMKIDELFKTEIPLEDFLRCQTISDVAKLIDEQRQP